MFHLIIQIIKTTQQKDSGIFRDHFLNTEKCCNIIERLGLKNSYVNRRVEFNQRKTIKDLSLEIFEQLEEKCVYRVHDVKIIDCSLNPIKKHCPLHGIRLKEEDLNSGICPINQHELGDGNGVWNFFYGAK